MYANFTSMHHNSCTATASCAAAASFCAKVQLGSSVLVESIFVSIIPLILAVVLIIPPIFATA